MWIMLNDAFFSIIKKDCGRNELLVRARRRGDINKVFGVAEIKVEYADYLYRAVVKAEDVAEVMTGELLRISYGNFKDSVTDDRLHSAYVRVWAAMAELQEIPPYGSWTALIQADAEKEAAGIIRTVKKTIRRKRK